MQRQLCVDLVDWIKFDSAPYLFSSAFNALAVEKGTSDQSSLGLLVAKRSR